MAQDRLSQPVPSSTFNDDLNNRSYTDLVNLVKDIVPQNYPSRESILNEIDAKLSQLSQVNNNNDPDVIRLLTTCIKNFRRHKHGSESRPIRHINEFIFHVSAELNIHKKVKERKELLRKARAEREATGQIDPILSLKERESMKKKLTDAMNRVNKLDSRLRKLYAKPLAEDDDEADSIMFTIEKTEKELKKAHDKYADMIGTSNLPTSRMCKTFQLKNSTGYPCIDREISEFITKTVRSSKHYQRPEFDALSAQIEKIAEANKLSIDASDLDRMTNVVNKQMISEYHFRMVANLDEDLESYLSDQSEEEFPNVDDPELKKKLEENKRLGKTESQVLAEFSKKYDSLTEEEKKALEAEVSSIENTTSDDDDFQEDAILTDSGEEGDKSSNDEEAEIATCSLNDENPIVNEHVTSAGDGEQAECKGQSKRLIDLDSPEKPPKRIHRTSGVMNSSPVEASTSANNSVPLSGSLDVVEIVREKRSHIHVIELSSDSE